MIRINKTFLNYICPTLQGMGRGWVLCGLCILCVLCAACKDDETYADQKKKETKAINAFLKRDPLILLGADEDTLLNTPAITVISQEQFEAQDSMTDVSKNEYVLFKNTGVYMQIVRKGVGEKLKSGDSKRVICRYWEYNILGDSLQSSSKTPYWMTNPDIMDVSNNSGTISASFNIDNTQGGPMYLLYGVSNNNSKAVPTGWIVPLSYVNIGRQMGEEGIALVRMILPHSQGTPTATNNVTPFFYEISYQETRD